MESSRILVASSEPHIRRILQFLLEVEGHEVGLAADGEEAWRSMTSFRPDLVITDAVLPQVDGLVLVAGMRARFDLAGVPVIILMAEASPAIRLRALQEGADDVLPRPFNQDELLLRVRNLLWSTRNTRKINHLPGIAALAEESAWGPGPALGS